MPLVFGKKSAHPRDKLNSLISQDDRGEGRRVNGQRYHTFKQTLNTDTNATKLLGTKTVLTYKSGHNVFKKFSPNEFIF